MSDGVHRVRQWRSTSGSTDIDIDTDNIDTGPSRVLLLVKNKGNHSQLSGYLSNTYEVIEPTDAALTNTRFDIAIADISGFQLYQEQLLDTKTREEPTFLPIVLIVTRTDLQKHLRSCLHIVDEFITTPIDVTEFSERIHMLIRARHLALTQKAKLAYLATHDRPTGLPNKHFFQEFLTNSVTDASVLDQTLYVTVIHLSLSRIMRSLGHHGLDRAAVACTSRLSLAFPENEIIARLTTEEWGVIHKPGTDMESLIEMYTRLNQLFELPITVNNEQIHISLRLGVGHYPDDAPDAASTLDCAMNALSQATDSMPNFYSREVQHNALRFIRTEARLHEAVKENQFELWYQPQIRLSDLRVTGAEALVRWRLPNGRIAPPEHFIATAESTGLICDIDRWVIDKACQTMESWRQRGFELDNIAVNISPIDIQQPDFAENIEQCLESYHLPPPSLELELTESTLFEATPETLDKLNALRQLGMNIAIDDFGTGYSSLSYIHRLPISVLKIDRSFVNNLVQRDTDEAIVKTIVWLAENFKLTTVAEGIENPDQARRLSELGVSRAQGFYYAEPMPEQEFQTWLREFR